MSYQPIQSNQIPEPPNQMVMVICSDYKRLKTLARFAPNIKREIKSYKRAERA